MVNQGDIIWLDFDGQAGHEQQGRRPAVVVSNESFNAFSSLSLVCPITHRDKNHPFHVKLDNRTKTTGVILCDQVRTVDIVARRFESTERIPADILIDIVDIISGFTEIENQAGARSQHGKI